MNLKFNKPVKNILLDIQTTIAVEKNKRYNFILSPSLYWVKKVSLPVKYTYEAKKLAPTLFEDCLPQGNYCYSAYKEGDSFVLFAYEDKKILELLATKGVSTLNIANIYFAQTELSDAMDEGIAYDLNDEEVLVKEEGIVLTVPKSWYENCETLNIEDLKLSNKSLRLQQFGHIVDEKTLYKISIVFVLFICLLIAQYAVLKHQKNILEQKRENLFSHYHLKPTMMQNRAILQSYTQKEKHMLKLKEYLETILKLPLQNQEKIAEIDYEKNSLRVVFEHLNQKRIKLLFSGLKKQKEFSTKTMKDKVVVEVKL